MSDDPRTVDETQTAPLTRAEAAPEHDPYYIVAPSSPADEHDLVLKQDETFAVFDHHAHFRCVGLGEEGLYHRGTRHLCQLSVRFGRQPPLFLSSAVREDNAAIAVDLTNPDLGEASTMEVPRGTLHLSRVLTLRDGVLHEQLTLRNYGLAPIATALVVNFEGDFVDIFEVRGTRRSRRGQRLPSAVDDSTVTIGYEGLDGVKRRTHIAFSPPPSQLTPTRAVIECLLAPQAEITQFVSYRCEQDGQRPSASPDFGEALASTTEQFRARRSDSCEIVTSHQPFNQWLERSLSDLAMMITDTPYGPYPYAGVPWFSTPFGRDGIITALECLWMNPSMAAGVLTYLASTQATEEDPDRDAQPGKILHETRSGEMAALGEIPFGRYYGSHDATPLFVMLAAAYYQRTADRDLIERIWPSVEAALSWIEQYGDADGDGFVEYARQSPTGLVQQGWKDSHDSVFHADGRIAEPPIALAEIQGYVYAAWRGAASLAAVVGDATQGERWTRNADRVRDRFEQEFWNEELGTYVLALDRDKRQCAVRSSNAGQVLFSGIASRERGRKVAETLGRPESFSGWGIRTLAEGELRYNPMSYHNGSIWPHDNALIAAGFQRYGAQEEALRVLSGMFDASLFMEFHRLPELFCGFTRRPGQHPTLYPVACSPQAWASGAVFMLLQAALGLEVLAAEGVVRFTRARLPAFLDRVKIKNLRVGSVRLDLLLERHEEDVGINILRRQGQIEVVAIK